MDGRLIIEELDSLGRLYPKGSRKGPRCCSWFSVTPADLFNVARQGREARELPPTAPPAARATRIPDFLPLDGK